ncbi:adenylate kinase 8 [Homalodisca vitripennis]|uniref:adenylate kinase 8 n=1 Tax=Homalodisca vitripennis TaxID=197043 RepID=UPI001EEB3DAD|nr:adenylate kinase 8 [Homalodisca vitripennis]
MMAVDASMRKLKIPAKFMPYLEKHRIYELFHDLGNKLAMEQPPDPIQFLKDSLVRLQEGRDHRVIILMTPPYFDRTRLSQIISQKTGYGIVSRYLVKGSGNFYNPITLAESTAKFISSSEREGWILSDFPDTVEEAKRLIKAGVLPTHAFLFLQNDQHDEGEIHKAVRTVDTSPSILLEYDHSIYRLRELFKSSLKVVKIKDRTVEDLADLCARLAEKMPPRLAPKLFRVTLFGPRGSRRRTLAKLLSRNFNLVHVDMIHLINSAKMMENDIGDEIRFYDKNNYTYTKKLIFQLVKDRLEQYDCVERGYVLTNFPTCVDDFVFLDSLDAPPNRVIFLDIDGNDCLTRLEDRVVNMYTGSLHSRKAIEGDSFLKSQSLPHPDDESCKVSEEIKFYMSSVNAMIDYCGGTCSIIDARGSTRSLLERVEAVLMGSSPASDPRPATVPRASLIERKPSVKPRISYPVTRTEVFPLIDYEDLIQRFKQLKGKLSSRNRGSEETEDSSNIEDDYFFYENNNRLTQKFESENQGGVEVIQLYKGHWSKAEGKKESKSRSQEFNEPVTSSVVRDEY